MASRAAWRAVASLLVLLPNPAAAKTYRLEPDGPWLMDYDTDSCLLAHAFGKGDDRTIAQFRRYEPGNSFELTLIGKPVTVWSGTDFPKVTVAFGRDDPARPTHAMTGHAGDLPVLFLGNHSILDPKLDKAEVDELRSLSKLERSRRFPVTPAMEAATNSMSVRIESTTVIVNLVSLGRPMEQMRKCTADLLKVWGFDPAQQESLRRSPVPTSSPANWLHSSDYPRGQLLGGRQAIVRFRLMVDAAGIPTACKLQSSIGEKDFGDTTCSLLMRRARFAPALDAHGTAVASYYVNSVRWIIPGPNEHPS